MVTPESNEWINHIESPKSDDSDDETRRGVMDGTIPSAVVDTGATSNVGKFGCGLKLTGNPSTNIFSTATGQKVHATETGIMEHELCEPARTYNMVPDITLDPLASTSKMCNTGYFSVFDEEEVRICNARTTKIVTSKPPVLKGWRDKISPLWRILLVKRAPAPDVGQVTN